MLAFFCAKVHNLFMRINKFLASCGIGSRRKVEELITAGKVKVNGDVINNLATDIDEAKDVVELNNKFVSPAEQKIYLMMHKPKGFICTKSDTANRKTIYDLIKGYNNFRLFSVGRLDRDTEGLLLITNDGDLTNKLTHPSHEIEKKYVVKIEGGILEKELNSLRKGVKLDDGFITSRAKVNILLQNKIFTQLEVIIHEGKNRQVRRMFEAIGKNVTFLKRSEFGPIKLGGLSRGTVRELKPAEIATLRKIIKDG